VAALFGKRHDYVLRDVNALELPPDLGTAFFRLAAYVGNDGTSRPCFEVTRHGLTFLVMGYTGPKTKGFTLA
jgi:Rha family phage regulatory protein